MEKKYLTKENVNSFNDLKTIEIEIEDYVVILRELSASQILAVQEIAKDKPEEAGFRIIAMSVVNESGDRLVSNSEANKVFGNYSTTTIKRLTDEIMRLNHMDKSVEDKVGDLKDDPLASS